MFCDAVNVNILELNEFRDDVNVFTLDVNAVNDAVCAVNELVSVNTVLSNPSNNSALDAYDAVPATLPVVAIAPDELTDIRVVEPLTNEMLPLASCFIILVRLDDD